MRRQGFHFRHVKLHPTRFGGAPVLDLCPSLALALIWISVRSSPAWHCSRTWRRRPALRDDAGAEARFKSISGAYDLSKDPATRARFDAGEIDAAGAERPPRQYSRDFTDDPTEGYRPRGGFRSQFGAGGDPNDIFADILRQRGGATGDFAGQDYAAPGRDLRFALEVPFLDAARVAELRLSLA